MQKQSILIKITETRYPTATSKKRNTYGIFKCICGQEFEAIITVVKNRGDYTCGCSRKYKGKHNLSSHRLYHTWNGMMQRCYNPKNKDFERYNGRGITVCESWHSIENFINDMDESYIKGLTMDRINNNLGYSKDNCRWITQEIQSRNTRVLSSRNTSGYRGVTYEKSRKKWRSIIIVNKNKVSIGSFEDKIEAAKAYDKYVIDNNLEHTINFAREI